MKGNMPEHLSPQQIESLIQRNLAAPQLLLVTAHLSACDLCRQTVRKNYGVSARVYSLHREISNSEVAHLSYEFLTGFVDETLPLLAVEKVKEHLVACGICTSEVSALRMLRDELTVTPVREEASISAPGLVERLKVFLRFPEYWRPLYSAAFATVFLVVIVELWQFTRPNEQQIVRSVPSSTTAPTGQTKEPVPAQTESAAAITAPKIAPTPSLAMNNSITAGIDQLPPDLKEMCRQVLARQKAPIAPIISDLNGRTGILMSGKSEGAPFALRGPVGTVTLSERPVFQWQPLGGAKNYTVEILDVNFNVLVRSEPLTVTKWTPPRALARNREYRWQVTAEKDGQQITSPSSPAPEARFKISGAVEAAHLKSLARQYPGMHLLLGSLYSQAGALDNAEVEFTELYRKNPQSIAARKLLSQVKILRH